MNPYYASSYVIELRKDYRCNYFVRILYKNDLSLTEFNYNPVNMRDCENFCSFNKFLEITNGKSVRPEEFDKVCAVY